MIILIAMPTQMRRAQKIIFNLKIEPWLIDMSYPLIICWALSGFQMPLIAYLNFQSLVDLF